jgi:hypothetical protein
MEKEQTMNITYHDLREISKEKAQELVRKVLENTGENVSKTARILKISRKTVRRARDGALTDYSRRPHRSPRRLTPTLRIALSLKAHTQAMGTTALLVFVPEVWT